MRKTSGVSLMLLIFLSLCLIIFSLLSLSGAVADETLSSQAANRTTEYYAAVTSANEVLAQIDTQLAAYLREAENPEATETKLWETENPDAAETKQQKAAYLRLCSRIDEDIPGVTWDDSENSSNDSGSISFSVDIDDDQILQIRLDISYPASDDDNLYRVHTWKVVNTGDWNADHSMHLFRSGNPS